MYKNMTLRKCVVETIYLMILEEKGFFMEVGNLGLVEKRNRIVKRKNLLRKFYKSKK